MSNMNDQIKDAESAAEQASKAKELSKELVVIDESEFSSYLDTAKYNQMWRVANTFASTQLIPKQYQGQPADCFIAIQMAVRLGVEPMMFMQSTYIVHGKPGMEAKLCIALINAKGPFTGPIQWRFEGKGKTRQCTAYATMKETGEVCESTVTRATVEAEGWNKNPKWQSMEDLMFQYRSASFLGRLYCPEVLMGMQTMDELEDFNEQSRKDVTPADFGDAAALSAEQKQLDQGSEVIEADPIVNPETPGDPQEPQAPAGDNDGIETPPWAKGE